MFLKVLQLEIANANYLFMSENIKITFSISNSMFLNVSHSFSVIEKEPKNKIAYHQVPNDQGLWSLVPQHFLHYLTLLGRVINKLNNRIDINQIDDDEIIIMQ